MKRLTFGSASIRASWMRRAAGSDSLPAAAAANSSSSGMEPHRKYDSLDASSQSLSVVRRSDGEPSSR